MCALRLIFGLRRAVSNSANLREQFVHRHAGERLEERGNLSGHLGDVARNLVQARGGPVAGGDHRNTVHVGERRRQRADDFRHGGDQLVDDRSLVELLVGLGLHVHGAGFGVAFLEDDLGFGFTLRANGGGAAFGFDDGTVAFGLGHRLDAAALEFGLLEHGGRQFGLAAQNFRLLHLDLMFLFHLVNSDFFGAHLLLHHVGLYLVRLIRRAPAGA